MAASAWQFFALVLQWVLSQRGQFEIPLWHWILECRIICEYTIVRSLHSIRTPHAWPTLLATRKGVSLKSFQCICSYSFIELWRAKVRSELQIYMAACYDLYQKIKGSVHVHVDTT